VRSSAIGVIAVVAGLAGGASPVGAASNPGTGDPGFFTFRPEPHAGATVNVASGNLLARARDLADSTLTGHVVVDRFYNSRADPVASMLGSRWGLDVASTTVVDSGERAVVAGPSGYRISMPALLAGTYLAPMGFDGALLRTSAGWTLERRSAGDAFFFSAAGRLVATRDARGRGFTVEYVAAGNGARVAGYGVASGGRVRFCYRGDGLLRGFVDPASGRHRYGYAAGRSAGPHHPGRSGGEAQAVDRDRGAASAAASKPRRCERASHGRGQGAGDDHPDHRPARQLVRVADERGTVASYGYDERGLLSSIRLRSGEEVGVEQTDSGRVSSFAVGGGADLRRTRFDYERRPYKTDVVGPDGARRTYAYDDAWRVTRQYDPDVSPSVRAAGELFDLGGRYVRGDRVVAARVSADEPDGAGLTRLAVDVDDRQVADVEIPCAASAFDLVCPTVAAADVSVDLATLAEGRHVARAAARDDERHRATSPPWSVTIDRTAPPVPENLRLERFGGGVATFGWDAPDDPDLPGGVAGSGVVRTEVRYGVNGSAFGPWAASEEDGVEIAGLRQGDVVGLEVRSVDAVGNVSGAATVALEVVARDEDPAVTQIAAEAYVEDYGGDLETARRWMLTQDLANNVDGGDLGEAVFDASPAHYGGIWFDNARRRMVVGLTAGASREAVEDVIAARGLAGVTDYRTSEYTQRELELAQPPLEDELADLVAAGLVALARVSSRNAIEIEVASGATAAQRARVDAAATAAPVRVLVTEVAGPTLGDEELRCRFPDCDLPLRGGVRIIGLQGRECTAGFLAWSRRDAKLYLMTAAHCMTDGNTGWLIMDTSGLRVGIGINDSVIGPRYEGDVGLIAIADRILADVRPWVFVTKSKTAGPVQTTRNPHYRITGSSRNREGAYVCFNGRTSGARCGEIKRVNTTFNRRKNLVRVAVCSNRGDSGAPFFKGGRAFGILSGHRRGIFGKCSGAYYTGARIAEDLLNVSISG